jgi:hypothetical protein
MAMRRTGIRSDDGFALAVTMGAIALITAVVIGGYVMADQTLAESVRGTNENRAYQLASTGLEQELSFFSIERYLSGYYPKSVPMDGGQYVANVTDLGGGVYELASEGRSAGMTETVTTRFQFLNLWDMNISGGDESSIGTRNGFNGSSTIIGSLYVNGDMDWGANGRLWGGPVFVKDGTWSASGNGQVGSSTDRVDAFGPVPSDGSHYFTNLKGSAPDIAVPLLTDEIMHGNQTEPPSYLSQARQYALENTRTTPLSGTQPANQDATYYTVFNGNTTFGSNFGDKDNDAIAVQSGVLYLKDDAVIYVDGTATFTSAITWYSGRGVIVSKTGFICQGSLRPQNGLTETLYGETMYRMDKDNCLGLLTQGGLTNYGDWINAAVFMNGNYSVPSSAHNSFRGSLICNSIDIQTTNTLLANQPGLAQLLPRGMPELSGFTARSDWVRR